MSRAIVIMYCIACGIAMVGFFIAACSSDVAWGLANGFNVLWCGTQAVKAGDDL